MEEYEVDLRDYFRVLWHEKWVIIVTFAAAVATALVISYSLPKQYQVETSLLILPPFSIDATGGATSGTIFSPETYRRLALASDLLEGAAERAFPDGGRPTVASLRQQFRVEVEQTTAKDFPGRFPLYLRVSVSGSNPKALVSVASAWAEQFTEKNSGLFTSRTAQSYDYFKQSFDQVALELRSTEEERAALFATSPVDVLRTEVASLNEVYGALVRDLSGKEQTLTEAEAKLAALKGALLAEPEHYTLVRGPTPEAIWNFASDSEAMGRLATMEIEDQVLNEAYVSLRTETALAKVAVQEFSASLSYLKTEVERIRLSLEERRTTLAHAEARLAELDREIESLGRAYASLSTKVQEARIAQGEVGNPIQVIDRPVLPDRSTGPNKKTNVAVAGFLGVLVGVLLAFLLHYLQHGRLERAAVGSTSEPPQGKATHNNA
jgi:uncharacterized protein involved in exopolysaccharide biosynthesis